MVGIYNPSRATATFSLVERDRNHISELSAIVTNESRTVTLPKKNSRSAASPDIRVFKWYNWEHGNFMLQTKALQGKANFYVNFVGETNYEENAISGIPINRNDSNWYSELDSFDADFRTAELSIYRFDTE